VSAVQSGVRFISFAIPEAVGIVLAGVLITKIGYYVIYIKPQPLVFHTYNLQTPFMIIAAIIGIIGTALLSTIGLHTDSVRWAAYMVVAGLGIGMGVQIPYTASQAVTRYLLPYPYCCILLKENSETDAPIGNGNFRVLLLHKTH